MSWLDRLATSRGVRAVEVEQRVRVELDDTKTRTVRSCRRCSPLDWLIWMGQARMSRRRLSSQGRLHLWCVTGAPSRMARGISATSSTTARRRATSSADARESSVTE
jgi:hypothetical protein